jgi:endoglucanase
MLFSLCSQFGASGCEGDVSVFAASKLSDYMKVRIDNLGNVIGELDGNGIHILLDAHIDQIGFIITAVEDNGFLRIASCGGIDMRVLAAHEVTVWGKSPLLGVITSTPPHLIKEEDSKRADDISDIAIDIGMSKENALKFIKPGDRVTLNSPQFKMLNNFVSSTAVDNRAGICSILRCLDILKDKKHDCRLTVIFSVQEETTGSGARVGGFSTQPDEALSVDVSFASAPEIPKDKTGEAGKGTMIGVSPTLDYEMSRKLEEIAKAKEIKYQLEIMGGKTGTNADGIQNAGKGTKTALLSIPIRNMHTGCEVVSLEDIESTAQLITAYILERGGHKNA